jgi:hypothetical protein
MRVLRVGVILLVPQHARHEPARLHVRGAGQAARIRLEAVVDVKPAARACAVMKRFVKRVRVQEMHTRLSKCGKSTAKNIAKKANATV